MNTLADATDTSAVSFAGNLKFLFQVNFSCPQSQMILISGRIMHMKMYQFLLMLQNKALKLFGIHMGMPYIPGQEKYPILGTASAPTHHTPNSHPVYFYMY